MRKGRERLIKIGLCDDIKEYNKRIENQIERYGSENHIEVKISSYCSGKQLILNFQEKKFDILFLDVSMPDLDGFETAERIRQMDSQVEIVFCTSYYTVPNVSRGYKVAARDFLAKPLLYKKIENLLNRVYRKKLINAEEKLFLKCHDGLITLQLSDIIYLQSKNKTLILHTINGIVKSNQKMYDLEKRLSQRMFYCCHNSFIVNFDYVEGIHKDNVLLKSKRGDLKVIPVSKYKKEEFLKALARYMGNQIEIG